MNCADAQPRLPELLYRDLGPTEAARVEEHLRGCAACQREWAALEEVRRLLDAAPAPTPPVDLPRLYRQAAATQQQQVRRWRRRAAVVTGLAAALVLVLLGLRLEARLDQHQLVLCWGSPPTEPVPAPSAPVLLPELPPDYASADAAEQLHVLRKLIHALVADVRDRDLRRQEQIAQMRAQVQYLENQSLRQWTATQRDVDTLYTAQFLQTKKGAIP